jgi:AcrR family transcriptional regulator
VAERADAARNRRAILRATEKLLTRYRPEEISLEQVAIVAGVGKGTVYHRFGTRAGLMLALMGERAETLAEAVAGGPPPLGPGAPAADRLLAFLDAAVTVVGRNVNLLAAVDHARTTTRRPPPTPPDQPPQPDRSGAGHDVDGVYLAWREHAAALLASAAQGTAADLDAGLLADLLLAPLHSPAVHQVLRDGGAERVAAHLRAVAGGLLSGSTGTAVPDGRAQTGRVSDWRPVVSVPPRTLR